VHYNISHRHFGCVRLCSLIQYKASYLSLSILCLVQTYSLTPFITMLGSGSFAFDSPNVIDPGELPPSRPQRQSSITQQEQQQEQQRSQRRGSNTDSTDDNSSSSDEFPHEPRNSAARLLRDIEDIDHLAQDYDPYDEEEAAAEAGSTHEQLPSVEEARMYATSLLSSEKSKRRSPTSERHHQQNQHPETVPLSFNRTIKLDARNSNHLVRARIIRCLVPFLMVAGLLGTTIALGLVLINRLAERDNSSSGNSVGPVSRYKQIVDFLAKDVSSKYDLETLGSPQEVRSNDSSLEIWLCLLVLPFPVSLLVLLLSFRRLSSAHSSHPIPPHHSWLSTGFRISIPCNTKSRRA
jgi:hypothetical protein